MNSKLECAHCGYVRSKHDLEGLEHCPKCYLEYDVPVTDITKNKTADHRRRPLHTFFAAFFLLLAFLVTTGLLGIPADLFSLARDLFLEIDKSITPGQATVFSVIVLVITLSAAFVINRYAREAIFKRERGRFEITHEQKLMRDRTRDELRSRRAGPIGSGGNEDADANSH